MRKWIDLLEEIGGVPTYTPEARQFIDSLTNEEFDGRFHNRAFYMKRDNCGICALDLIAFHGWADAKRIRGYVEVDIPVHAKRDFTKEMLKEFKEQGYDFSSKEDRLKFISNSKYSEEWKKAPHYWVLNKGIIHDSCGNIMFKEFLTSPLTDNRYHEDSAF